MSDQNNEIPKEAVEEPGLVIPPPQLNLQQEPIPNPDLDAYVKNVEKEEGK